MPTIQQQLNQLKIDKQNLVSMLNNMGVEATNNETFTSLTPKVGKIVTDPILQDKVITITENGTTSIVADEGYDGLNNVEVNTNVMGKPDVGLVIASQNADGYATEIEIYGELLYPKSTFSNSSNHDNEFMNYVEKITISDTTTNIPQSCFQYNNNLKEVKLGGVQEIGSNAFQYCTSLAKITASNVTNMAGQIFIKTNIQQISLPKIKDMSFDSNYTSPLYNMPNLYAVWFGSELKNMGKMVFQFSYSKIKKIFIDLPRTTVEQFTGYSMGFAWNQISTDIIICNDDEDFMTQEEFDAIDWATYIG